MRLLLVSGLLALLTGCVSVGSTHVLFTPIGVLALHSFKRPEARRDTDEVDVVAAARNPLSTASIATAEPSGSRPQ